MLKVEKSEWSLSAVVSSPSDLKSKSGESQNLHSVFVEIPGRAKAVGVANLSANTVGAGFLYDNIVNKSETATSSTGAHALQKYVWEGENVPSVLKVEISFSGRLIHSDYVDFGTTMVAEIGPNKLRCFYSRENWCIQGVYYKSAKHRVNVDDEFLGSSFSRTFTCVMVVGSQLQASSFINTAVPDRLDTYLSNGLFTNGYLKAKAEHASGNVSIKIIEED